MKKQTIFLLGICFYFSVAVSMDQQLVPFKDRSITIIQYNNNLSFEERLSRAEKNFRKTYLEPESIWKGVKLIDVDKKNNFTEIFSFTEDNDAPKQQFIRAVKMHSDFCNNARNSSYVSLLSTMKKNNIMKQESMKRIYEEIEARNNVIQEKRDNCDFKITRWNIFAGSALGTCAFGIGLLFNEQFKSSVVFGSLGIIAYLWSSRRIASLTSLERGYRDLMFEYRLIKFWACYDFEQLKKNNQQ